MVAAWFDLAKQGLKDAGCPQEVIYFRWYDDAAFWVYKRNGGDVNPDELLNRDLKAALSKTPAAKRNGEREEHAKSHMRSIQKQPEKIKALFHKESVKYAG